MLGHCLWPWFSASVPTVPSTHCPPLQISHRFLCGHLIPIVQVLSLCLSFSWFTRPLSIFLFTHTTWDHETSLRLKVKWIVMIAFSLLGLIGHYFYLTTDTSLWVWHTVSLSPLRVLGRKWDISPVMPSNPQAYQGLSMGPMSITQTLTPLSAFLSPPLSLSLNWSRRKRLDFPLSCIILNLFF